MWFSILTSGIIIFNLTVRDKTTQQPIPEAQIECTEHHEGGVADQQGQIRLQIRKGKHHFKISHIAYHPLTLETVFPGSDSIQTIYLTPQVIPLPEVTVQASAPDISDARVISYQALLRQIPVAGPDIFRALQNLPEITAISDYSSAPIIRGLPAGYTHFYLGQAPLLNPYHVGGIVSGLDYGMIGQTIIYPGTVPARYGNYGSGLIQLIPRFTSNPTSAIEFGLVSTTVRTLRMPLPNWYSSFSGRYFTLDLIARLFRERMDYGFGDIFWNNRWAPTEDFHVELDSYFSTEFLPNSTMDSGMQKEEVQTRPGYQNLVFNFDWRWRDFHLNLFDTRAPMEMQTNRNWIHNLMHQTGIRGYYTHVFANWWLRYGGDWQQTRLNYEWHLYRSLLDDLIQPAQVVFFDNAPADYKADFHFQTLAGFAEVHWDLPYHAECLLGIRLERYHQQLYPMPRLSWEQPIGRWQFAIGYGRVYQYTYTLKEKYNMEFFMPFSIRFPADEHPIDIQSLTFQVTPPVSGLAVNLFGRRFKAFPIYDWNRETHWRTDGFAAGLELSYAQKLFRGDWQLNYTGSISRMAWQRTWIPMGVERPHQLKMLLDFPLSGRWRWGLQFQLASGNPYSTVSHWIPAYAQSFIFDGIPLDFAPRYNRLNNARYPAYHRLDVSVEKDWPLWHGILTLRLTILNLYNHQNPFFYENKYEYYYFYEGVISEPELEKIPNLPFLPLLHLAYHF